MNSPADVHQKERISVDVDIFSGTLDIFERNAGYSDPSFHFVKFTNKARLADIGTNAGRLLYFSRKEIGT